VLWTPPLTERSQDEHVSLIHIPLRFYPLYVQPLLQLLYPESEHEFVSNGTTSHRYRPSVPWASQHPFLNISITPLECSVVCSKDLAQKYFAPLIPQFSKSSNPDQVSISPQDFIVISVEGEGLEAGRRVLELTGPLALAGMYAVSIPPSRVPSLTVDPSSILFITTYFSDYILVPSPARAAVISALSARGFIFSHLPNTQISAHHRNASSNPLPGRPPGTPPPKTISELQARTIDLLARHGIVPKVHEGLRLLHCAGDASRSAPLQIGLAKCLAHPPRFLSLTLTEAEAPSVLIAEDALRKHFFNENEEILYGSKDAFLIPISLDLRRLPLEASGIACGVMGRLVGGDGEMPLGDVAVEMTYLSTARAGTIMVERSGVGAAVRALEGDVDEEGRQSLKVERTA
jgi:hypothetical protein